jgi:hypothetical protein
MAQKMVKVSIPFEALVASIANLSLTEKHLLGESLAELRETRADYQAEIAPLLDETVVELKRQVASLLDTLPETKLAVVFDFVRFLTEQEQQLDWLNIQSQSVTYQEWIGNDNDIYDEIFAEPN